jgi:hypothetical protein
MQRSKSLLKSITNARLAAPLMILVGLVVAPVASASAATGVCEGAYCMRSSPSQLLQCPVDACPEVDLWNRDISGDQFQQWTVAYQGAVSSTWPFTNRNLDTIYRTNGVYRLEQPDTFHGGMLCALPAAGTQIGLTGCGNAGNLWVKDGSGHLVNVYQSDIHNGNSYDLQAGSDYHVLFVQNKSTGNTQWTFVTI